MKTKLAICILAVITVFSACGSSDSTSEASFNAADVMFAQMMIPHHEQAIEMSDIALDPTVTASPAVIELANEIKSAQDPEISLMKSFLAEWNEPLTPDDGMDHGSMMDGMLTTQQLNSSLLSPARGSRSPDRDCDQSAGNNPRLAHEADCHFAGSLGKASQPR